MNRQERIALHIVNIFGSAGLALFNFHNARLYGLPAAAAALTVPVVGSASMIVSRVSMLVSLLKPFPYDAFDQPSEIIVIENGRITQAIDACASAAMMAAAVVGWPGLSGWGRLYDNPLWNLAFFVIGAFGLLMMVSTPRLQISISERGIEHSQIRPKNVSWHNVAEVKLRKVLSTATITFQLREDSRFHNASSFWRWKRASAIAILPTMMGIDPDRLFEAIELRRMAAVF